MLSRRAITGPVTGCFQMPVKTVRPCQDTSFGMPTFTDRTTGAELVPAAAMAILPGRSGVPTPDDLVGGEVAVDAVRDHALTRLHPQAGSVEVHIDLVGLERHQPTDAADLRPGVLVRPRGAPGACDVVVA